MNEDIVEEIKRDLPDILSGDGEKLIESATKLGKHLSRKLSTSQIRNIYEEVKKMREFDRNRLNLLRAKLAYTAGRHGDRDRKTGRLVGPIVDLQEVLDEAIKKVDEKTFGNFQNFFEAILAYHRYYGGKE
ncbi:MAG TPA: type III-A CRISPR-associated protein Csm2 [Candidatus Atribacteria bacterium]|nr:type III-A CRISPR-associated protein Csm2 [Candidatus Atribacteria bacterium]